MCIVLCSKKTNTFYFTVGMVLSSWPCQFFFSCFFFGGRRFRVFFFFLLCVCALCLKLCASAFVSPLPYVCALMIWLAPFVYSCILCSVWLPYFSENAAPGRRKRGVVDLEKGIVPIFFSFSPIIFFGFVARFFCCTCRCCYYSFVINMCRSHASSHTITHHNDPTNKYVIIHRQNSTKVEEHETSPPPESGSQHKNKHNFCNIPRQTGPEKSPR